MDQENPNIPTVVVTPTIGAVRLNGLKCPCGRAYTQHDLDIDENGTISITCAGCHRRAIEIECGRHEEWPW